MSCITIGRKGLWRFLNVSIQSVALSCEQGEIELFPGYLFW